MPKNTTLYSVILTGDPKLGEDIDDVVERLAPLLKLEPEKARRLLSGKPRPVGKPVERPRAEKILRLLSNAGADCYIEQIDEALPRSLHRAPPREPPHPSTPLRPKSQPLGPLTEKLAPSAWSLEPVIFGAPPSKAEPETPETPAPFFPARDEDSGLSLAERPVDDGPSFKKPELIVCPKCGHEQPAGEECEACGIIFHKYQPVANREEASVPSAARAEASRGRRAVAADGDLELFIGPNGRTYLDKFENFRDARGEHFALTWHWPALFVPFFWALYRKLWLWSILTFISTALLPLISNVGWALTANYLYFRHARAGTERVRGLFRGSGIEQQIARAGGTSAGAVWIAIIALVFLQYWIYTTVLSPMFRRAGDITQAVLIRPQDAEPRLGPELARNPAAVRTLAALGVLEVGVKFWFATKGRGRQPDEVTWDEILSDLKMPQKDLANVWNTPIRYEGYPTGFALRSAGPDRLFGAGDDIERRREI